MTLSATITATALKTALEAIPGVGSGKTTVTGGPGGTGPLIVTFDPTLNCPTMAVNGAGLTGGSHTISLTTSGETQQLNRGMGGNAIQMSDGNLRRLSSVWSTSAKFRWLAGASGSTLDFYVDGVAVHTGVDASVVGNWSTGALTAGQHTFGVLAHGTVLVDYVYTYNGNETSGVQVWMSGHSGDTAKNMAANYTDLAAALEDLDPDLVLLEPGVNDFGEGDSAATFQASMETLIGKVITGDRSLALWIAQDVLAHGGLNAAYLPVLQSLAVEHGAVIINMADYIASTAVSDAHGDTIDGVHYSTQGGETVSRATAAVLMAHERGVTPALDATGTVPGTKALWTATSAGVGLGGPSAWISDTGFGQMAINFGTVGGTPGLTVGQDILNSGLTGSVSALADTLFVLTSVPGVWTLGTGKITGATIAPSAASDLVPKSHIDALATHAPAACVATGALASNIYNNGTSGVGATLTASANGALATIDGYAPQIGDVIVVNGEATQPHNGRYSVTSLGAAGSKWVLTRTSFFDEATEMKAGARFIVLNGTVYAGTIWYLTATVSTTGTTNVVFAQLAVAGPTVSADLNLNAHNINNVAQFEILSNVITPGQPSIRMGQALAPYIHFADGGGGAYDTELFRSANSEVTWTDLVHGSTGINQKGVGTLTFGDGKNLVFGTTTGTQIGTATNQPIGFHGTTPSAQRANANQAAAPAGGTGATAGAFDTAAHRDTLINLVNEMRTVLVNKGLMKGSA